MAITREELIKFVEKFGNKIEGSIFNGEIIRFTIGVDFYLDKKFYLTDFRSSLNRLRNPASPRKEIPDNTKVVLTIEDSIDTLKHKLTGSLNATLKNAGDVIKIDGREYVINSSINFGDVFKIEPGRLDE